MKNTFEQLIGELKGFKDKTDFHEFGFGIGGPYYGWIERVQDIQGHGGLSDYVRQLGMEYMKSKGQETQYTKWFYENCLQE